MMRIHHLSKFNAATLLWLTCFLCPPVLAQTPFIPLFDGKTLDGWTGDKDLWRVEKGEIIGETTIDSPIPHNSFLIWQDGAPANFHLVLEFKLESGNSGVQYRSRMHPRDPFRVAGFQADIANKYLGILYGEAGAGGILAKRGERVMLKDSGSKPIAVSTEKFADESALLEQIDFSRWIKLEVMAKENIIVHRVNGRVFAEIDDQSNSGGRVGGLIALQLHRGKPMKVRFRNIQLRSM